MPGYPSNTTFMIATPRWRQGEGPIAAFGALLVFLALLALAIAIALASLPAMVSGSAYAATARPAPPAIGGALHGDVWRAYRDRFVAEDGRVVDSGNNGISHSEGQGYGMLLAVAGADRAAFDRVWAWTKTNLFVRPDGMAAWKWSPATGRLTDRNNATDGDILIAWALAEAAAFWNDDAYRSQAMTLVAAIRNRTIHAHARHGLAISPGVAGFSGDERPDGPVINLSYWVFPALQRFAQLDQGYDWNAVVQNGLRLLQISQAGASRLPPEWSSLAGQTLAPAQGFETAFSYNAVRIPLYLAWAGDEGKAQLRLYAQLWSGAAKVAPDDSAALAKFRNLGTREPGYASIFALALCIGGGEKPGAPFFRVRGNYHYYSMTLHALTLVAAASVSPQCVREGAEPVIAPGWSPAPFQIRANLTEPSVNAATGLAGLSPGEPRSRVQPLIEPDNFERLGTENLRAAELIAPGRSQLASFLSMANAPALAQLLALALPLALVFYFWKRRRQTRSVPFAAHDGSPRVANLYELDIYFRAQVAASIERGQKFGLIYAPISEYWNVCKGQGDGAAQRLMASVCDLLRNELRKNDVVFVHDRNEIVVATPHLQSAQDIGRIARRLRIALADSGLSEAPGAAMDKGVAIYPLDGYNLQDMIDSARFNYCRAIKANEPRVRETLAASEQARDHRGANVAPARVVMSGAPNPHPADGPKSAPRRDILDLRKASGTALS